MSAATEALRDAEKAVRDLEEQRRQAVRIATEQVHAQFAERLENAALRRITARKAVDAERLSEAEGNPWIGKKVVRAAVKGGFSYKGRPEAIGVIEVFNTGDHYASGYAPDVGSLVIRHLTKSGAPGKKIERIHRDPPDGLPLGWVIQEETK